jgi:predicted dienelactone hydrolase
MSMLDDTTRRVLIGAAAGAILAPAAALALDPPADVHFAQIKVPYGDEPALDVGVWYPGGAPSERCRTLVVLSHGGGGSLESHADTAIALAKAGFVAAAPSHRGDTYDDQSQVLKLWRRPDQLHRVVDYMLGASSWRGELDPGAVGAFGFSNGGFTVLVAAGGRPDLGRIAPYCDANPSHDLCQLLRQAGVSTKDLPRPPPDAWVADPRIKAIVVAAPAFGFAFDRAGLAPVRVPVQLWGGAEDRHQPPPGYEDAVRHALPRPPEFHRVPNAGHYDFLPPCDARLAALKPAICASLPGFDRAAFHAQFNAAIVAFFGRTLRSTRCAPVRPQAAARR